MAVAKQIGNAVPIKLGEALLKPIIRLLLTQQSVRDIPQSEKVYFDKECIR